MKLLFSFLLSAVIFTIFSAQAQNSCNPTAAKRIAVDAAVAKYSADLGGKGVLQSAEAIIKFNIVVPVMEAHAGDLGKSYVVSIDPDNCKITSVKPNQPASSIK